MPIKMSPPQQKQFDSLQSRAMFALYDIIDECKPPNEANRTISPPLMIRIRDICDEMKDLLKESTV